MGFFECFDPQDLARLKCTASIFSGVPALAMDGLALHRVSLRRPEGRQKAHVVSSSWCSRLPDSHFGSVFLGGLYYWPAQVDCYISDLEGAQADSLGWMAAGARKMVNEIKVLGDVRAAPGSSRAGTDSRAPPVNTNLQVRESGETEWCGAVLLPVEVMPQAQKVLVHPATHTLLYECGLADPVYLDESGIYIDGGTGSFLKVDWKAHDEQAPSSGRSTYSAATDSVSLQSLIAAGQSATRLKDSRLFGYAAQLGIKGRSDLKLERLAMAVFDDVNGRVTAKLSNLARTAALVSAVWCGVVSAAAVLGSTVRCI
jgi:hypothetical protein